MTQGVTADRDWSRRMRAATLAMSAVAATIACAALAGWTLGIEDMKSVLPGLPTMKANTALAILSLAGGIIARPAPFAPAWPGAAMSLAGMAIGLAVTIEYLAVIDLGIDHLVVGDLGPSSATAGRPSLVTALSLLLLGIGGALAGLGRPMPMVAVADGATLVATLFGAFAGSAYLYDLHAQDLVDAFRAMSIPTALAILLLGIATLAARGVGGPLGFLARDGVGARIARLLLPALLIVPLVADSLVLLAIRSYGLDTATALAISSVAYLTVLSGLLVFATARLDRIDAARAEAEQAVRMANLELEERVRQRTGELEAAKRTSDNANAAKSLFLASMSHEIRTPLTATIGFAQLLAEAGHRAGDAVATRHAERIVRSGRHLLRLMDDLLDLGQIESGNLTVTPGPVRVLDALDTVQAMMSPMAAERGVKLTFQTSDAGLWVMADPDRLTQVLFNLVNNGIKYNRLGGSVVVAAHSVQADGVTISVTDTGIGIDPGRQVELFQPFNRLGREQGAIEGTGIGLAITRRLIAVMGGTVRFESSTGSGSRFWIELPRTQPPAGPAYGETPESFVVTEAGARRRSLRVLYVEDDMLASELMEAVLSTLEGVTLTVAHTVAAGIRAADELKPDLVFVDINLPDGDGTDVLRRLRAVPATRSVRVVALSAHAAREMAATALDAGFDDYLTKPFDVGAIRRYVAGLAVAPDIAAVP